MHVCPQGREKTHPHPPSANHRLTEAEQGLTGHSGRANPIWTPPHTADPTSTSPHTTEPTWMSTHTTDPIRIPLHTADPTRTPPHTTDPTSTSPHTTDPIRTPPHTADPTRTPHTTYPTSTSPHTTDCIQTPPHTTDPTWTPPHTADPTQTPPHTADPTLTSPYTAEPTQMAAHNTDPTGPSLTPQTPPGPPLPPLTATQGCAGLCPSTASMGRTPGGDGENGWSPIMMTWTLRTHLSVPLGQSGASPPPERRRAAPKACSGLQQEAAKSCQRGPGRGLRWAPFEQPALILSAGLILKEGKGSAVAGLGAVQPSCPGSRPYWAGLKPATQPPGGDAFPLSPASPKAKRQAARVHTRFTPQEPASVPSSACAS
ncbi:hypothetical protein P7K49_002165 [Saguinus oedipus]|uniref:Uncharacterized protein n=1 Tax=Saguinus oedipus TaxID=9490 RepID=A0ABQ9WGK5_SAGOE|nr:hypothetical protein P7K49_002165 [Saguinus oedipus]